MTYESTGEIRKPLLGEYYILWGLKDTEMWRDIVRMEENGDLNPEKNWKRIIMRPLDE